MKPSSVRLKLIAGTLGVLAISQLHRLDAQTPLGEAGRPLGGEGRPLSEEGTPLRLVGRPIGEVAVPLSQEGTPLSQEGTPLSQDGTPLSQEGTPLSQEGTPLSQQGTPLSQEGTPLSQEGTPLSNEGTPLSQEGTPLSQEGTPLSQDGTPLSKEGTPLADVGIPLADYGTPAQQAQELRRRNREAAMNDPKTAAFFGGDADTRRQNASKNLAGAIAAAPAEDDESVSQQDAEDREWSRGAIDSAESRPRDLFSSDWWEKHPDVLEGDAKYYTEKPAYAWWQGSPWGDLVRVLGMRNLVEPFKYRNDRNVVFNNDVIYVNGQPVSSYDDYVHSARSLVEPNPQEVGKRQGWYPLGTFAVSANSKTKVATHAFQLAMDSLGNIAGVSVNWPEGKVLPIRGRVDTNTQRVAFSVGGSDTVVVETGLANLTDPYTRAWAHLPSSHSQTWLMTRIRE